MSAPGKRSGAIDTLRETWDFALGMFRFAEDQEAAIAVDQDFDAALSDLVALLEAAEELTSRGLQNVTFIEYDALAAAVLQVERT